MRALPSSSRARCKGSTRLPRNCFQLGAVMTFSSARVKCFCTPGRYPAINDSPNCSQSCGNRRVKKSPRSAGGRREPRPSPTPDSPAGSGRGTGPCAPRLFLPPRYRSRVQIPLLLSLPPPKMTDRARACSPVFTFRGKIPFFFPGLNSSFPCFYVFSDRKKGKSLRGPRAGPRQAGGLRQGGSRGSGLKVPSGGAPRCPRRCPPS